MKRSRRSISAGAALTVLLVSASVGGATAASDPQDPSQQAGADNAARAEQGPRRKSAVEPKGRPASPGEMAAGRVSCGQVITRSTTLTRDVGPCPADGIILGADNIQLNLNGHTISGTRGIGDGEAAGVRLPFKTGVKITGHPGNSGKKGTVTGFDGGVFVNGGSKNTIENLVIRDNIGPNGDLEPTLADGIVLFHSGKNRILNNRLTHNGPYDGIGVLGHSSSDNLLRGNTVEDTPASESPFTVTDGVGILINNFLDEQGTPRRGEPIFRNKVIDNVVRRNDNSGISNVTHVDGQVEGNLVDRNGSLDEVCERRRTPDGSAGPRVCRPAATPSNGIGVTTGEAPTGVAASGDTRMLIRDNRVTGNTGDGIAIGAPPEFMRASENRIIGNVATGNGGSGNVFRSPFDGPSGRYDLHDFSTTQAPCEGRRCPPPQPSCDDNVWRDNIFDTAFPPCAAGGRAANEGPEGDATCSDGRDNDLDGAVDGADPDCIPASVFEPI